MFYPTYCKTDIQKVVFDGLMKSPCPCCIQDLEYLGLPLSELSETLKYFESKGLLQNVQHLGGDCPVIFSVKQ